MQSNGFFPILQSFSAGNFKNYQFFLSTPRLRTRKLVYFATKSYLCIYKTFHYGRNVTSPLTTGEPAPVVQGSLDAYRHAEGWSYYASTTVEYPAPPAPPYITPFNSIIPKKQEFSDFLAQ